MTKVSFFESSSSLTVSEIAALTKAQPRDGADLLHPIHNIAPIDVAGPNDLAFLDEARFAVALGTTRAGAVLTTERFEQQAPQGVNVLRASKPYEAFVMVAQKLYRGALRPTSVFGGKGVAPGAHIHPSARLADDVTVDPGAVIGPEAEIAAGTLIGAHAVIGPRVQIGRDCAIGAGCSVAHSVIADRVIIHPNCCIGQDGFGYVGTSQGHLKVPQIGRVVIHDDVEIGAGTCIDRGGMRDTTIGQGTKIDNLVQIGHNVTVGRHCIIVGQVGIAGSVTLEDFVLLGARVGVIPHIRIGQGAQIAALSSVMRDVPAGERWGGYPNAKPVRQWLRETAMVERLAAPRGKAPSGGIERP